MKHIFLAGAMLFGISINAAAITGKVLGVGLDGKKEPLVAADVFWYGTTKGTTTDENGNFKLDENKKTNKMVVAYIGYKADTVTVNGNSKIEVLLKANDNEIDEVLVQGQQKGNFLSKVNPITTEVISYTGLCKMACCNLAESFENSATVTVGFSDAVTGTKQIRMLGLAGMYTQMLDENRPTMRGLSSTYGLGYTPGMWLEGIQVSKGTSSVVNGYEAITGQINLDYRKPTSDDKLFVNAYFNNELHAELNVVGTIKVNNKLSGNILAHGSKAFKMMDMNNDGFADGPQTQQLNVATRWLYTFNSGAQLRTGLKFVYEDRLSGQTDFDKNKDKGDTIKYGSLTNNKHFNAYAKLGIPFGNDDRNSVALVADYTLHQQDAYFGLKTYYGEEHSAYVNGLLQMGFGERHSGTFGVNLRADIYDEKYSFGSRAIDDNTKKWLPHQNEYVTGVFGEYTFHIDNKFSAIAGLRVDYNNLYDVLVTPRGHLKYNITDDIVVRASGGRGFRSANIVTDNIWIMASQRDIMVREKPKIEEAWTYGASITKYFKINDEERASISADFFRTSFSNQVIIDQEVNNNQIWIYNLNGKSYANNFQIDISVEPIERFNILTTFRYSDTKVQLEEMGFVKKPLVDNFKGLINLAYATKFNKWIFDFTAQLNGQSRLPSNQYIDYGQGYDYGDGYSPIYPMFFAQVTKRFRNLDIYAGCENILDYVQDNPVISASRPFDESFNASVVWGPLMGRKFYIGIRWTL